MSIQGFKNRINHYMDESSVLYDEPMARHTTFRVGGPAEIFLSPSIAELQTIMALVREEEISCTVIGNGSNLLVSDEGLPGVVIELGKQVSDIRIEGTRVIAEAGALLSTVANRAAKESLGGMEFAAGIPGSIGGAVVMNAGAYGGEIKDILVSATVLTADNEIVKMTGEELQLSYRHSILQEVGGIVLQAEFELEQKPQDAIYGRMEELKVQRIEKQPLEYPSAGSAFKRPEGHFAGKLIMDAGLRGFQVGGAQVSEKHCGFVINRGDATASDIWNLMKQVRAIVRERFGVELEPEVRLLGSFKD